MLEAVIDHLSVANVLIGLAVAALLRHLVLRINEERKIKQLGGHAAARTTWVPLGLPIVYDAVRYLLAHRNLELWQMQFRVYGRQQNPYTIESRIVGARIVLTADEENIKAILATQFADYGKGEVFNREWHDFLGDSIFTTDGPKWHEARHLLRPQFIKNRVSDLHIFERHVAVLLPLLERGSQGPADADVEVDLVDLFFRFTLDAATEFLLGTSVDSLLNPRDRFASAFAAVQHTQSLIARTGPLNILVPRRAFHAGLKVMDEVITPYIGAALRLSPAELAQKSKSDEGYNFLYALAAYTRDRTVLRDQIAAVLLAGRDTTACTLSWLFDALSRNPSIVRKLRREISATVGMDRNPTYADLKGMRYLQHTINETLRLYPIVPFNVRVALRDTTLPRGGGKDGDQPMAVLKGTPVGYSTLALQMREDIYPPASQTFPDHRDFVPERWEGWTPRPWTYVPFNGGPRICIGQQFALTEVAYTTVRILQTFSGIESRMEKQPALKTDIVLQPAEGVRVAFTRDEK